VDEKVPSGTSLRKDGGCAFAIYTAKNVQFTTTPLTPALFGAVKVGEAGEAKRLYSRCCNTLVFGMGRTFFELNRNCIYKEDGSNYEPSKPVLNIQKKNAFEPSIVPDPAVETWPPLRVMIPLAWKLFHPFSSKVKDKALFPDPKTAEMVPITWE
jgi:hypothetical protein